MLTDFKHNAVFEVVISLKDLAFKKQCSDPSLGFQKFLAVIRMNYKYIAARKHVSNSCKACKAA